MIGVSIHFDGDGCWPDLIGKEFKGGKLVAAAWLDGGMLSGSPSVSLRCELSDGSTVVVETSLKLFMMVAAAFKGNAMRKGIDV